MSSAINRVPAHAIDKFPPPPRVTSLSTQAVPFLGTVLLLLLLLLFCQSLGVHGIKSTYIIIKCS